MFRFLHIGDIHLGNKQYKLNERQKDFFQSFASVCDPEYLEKHKVDFIIITGDLFDMPSISAEIFNQCTYVLKKLNIPVIAIEGNHDLKEFYKFSSVRGSWYEALAQNQLLYFLYQRHSEDGSLLMEPLTLDKKYIGGNYIDLTIRGQSVRIIGSRWYGAHSGKVLSEYAESIKALKENNPTDYSIFLFHAGHENHLPIECGGVSSVDFGKMESAVNYIALGHVHQFHVIENAKSQPFIFNPGSLEANNIMEAWQERGALLSTVDDNQETTFKLLKDYYQRQFINLGEFDLSQFVDAEQLSSAIELKASAKINREIQPVIYIKLTNSPKGWDLNSAVILSIESAIKELGALHCIIKQIINEDSSISTDTESFREKIPIAQIFEDVIKNDEETTDKQQEKLFQAMLKIKKEFSSGKEAEAILNILSE